MQLDLKSFIREIPDFPQPGIQFKDITTLLQHGPAFRQAILGLAQRCRHKEVDIIVAPEARGFLIGAPLAVELAVGFVPVRKKGKLPAPVHSAQYELEYGWDWLEMHRDACSPGQNVLVVDDLLATGGTIKATVDMVENQGGKVVALAFLVELTHLQGRDQFPGHQVISLIQY